jgi:hypothetical protein
LAVALDIGELNRYRLCEKRCCGTHALRVALLNPLATFPAGDARLTVPVDARVPKLSTGGSYGHSRILPQLVDQCPVTRCPVSLRHAGMVIGLAASESGS